MPVHRVPRARLHEDIVAIEREHEIIQSIVPDPDDSSVFIVATRWCGDVIEVRPAGVNE